MHRWASAGGGAESPQALLSIRSRSRRPQEKLPGPIGRSEGTVWNEASDAHPLRSRYCVLGEGEETVGPPLSNGRGCARCQPRSSIGEEREAEGSLGYAGTKATLGFPRTEGKGKEELCGTQRNQREKPKRSLGFRSKTACFFPRAEERLQPFGSWSPRKRLASLRLTATLEVVPETLFGKRRQRVHGRPFLTKD
jgi:hypothetical protein